jgi:hypothetical protein
VKLYSVYRHIPLDRKALTAMATVAGFPYAQPKSIVTFTWANYRPRLTWTTSKFLLCKSSSASRWPHPLAAADTKCDLAEYHLWRHCRALTTQLQRFWCERNDHKKRRRIFRLSLSVTVSTKCVNHFTNNSLSIKLLSWMHRQSLAVPHLWGIHRILLIWVSKQKLLV